MLKTMITFTTLLVFATLLSADGLPKCSDMEEYYEQEYYESDDNYDDYYYYECEEDTKTI